MCWHLLTFTMWWHLSVKGYMIKEFFANNLLLAADVTIDLRKNEMELDEAQAEPWRVTAIWSNGLGCITQLRRQAPCGYLGDCRL
jgi:alpha-D-ribose 1-methylphosphonate 5-triphosphate synthase subunit PhnL